MKPVITLIPGDGIGPAVTAAVVRVLVATSCEPEWDTFSADAEAVKCRRDLPSDLGARPRKTSNWSYLGPDRD